MTAKHPTQGDRRHATRVRLADGARGHELESGEEVLLRDISPESFSVESNVPFQVGTKHHLQFPGETQAVTVTAVVRRCERASPDSKAAHYVVGFEFTWKTPADRAHLASVVQTLRRQ